MKKKIFDIQVETTADCVALLKAYKPAKWKRKSKFNIKFGEDASIVRTFSDGTDTVSLISTGAETILCVIDLQTLKPTIDKIQELAKKVYTHDYGDILLNPWDMTLWVVGGDGGIFVSDKTIKEIAKIIEDDGFDGVDDESEESVDQLFSQIDGITHTRIEAEYFPDDDDENEPYIKVANAVDICNLEDIAW